MGEVARNHASFRDPSGFVFNTDGKCYRQVNRSYQEHYEHLMRSGLYQELVDRELLVSHEEVPLSAPEPDFAWKVLRPEYLSFISYPYEWCFSQLKDAARVTLEAQQAALKYGMWLKDASAYNIQFRNNRPVLIDTLSFEKCRPGEPWPAYRQFCQHFLAPLALASCLGPELLRDLAMHLDGFPLERVSQMLPRLTYFRPSLLMHIHLHAKASVRWGDFRAQGNKLRVGENALAGLAESLMATVGALKRRAQETRWSHYYEQKSRYTEAAIEQKKKIVLAYLDGLRPATVWDFGCNTGVFSFLAAEKGIPTFAVDSDEAVVEALYRECADRKETRIFPCVQDLVQPSPGTGWMGQERKPFLERCRADAGLALALLHHMAIGNNLSFGQIALFFRKTCRDLIIEFVPKADPQVQSLMGCREDIFPDYHQENFEKTFSSYFAIEKKEKIPESERCLYLMTGNRHG